MSRWTILSPDRVEELEPTEREFFTTYPKYTIYASYGGGHFNLSKERAEELGKLSIELIFWTEKEQSVKFHVRNDMKSILNLAFAMVYHEIARGNYECHCVSVLGFEGKGPKSNVLKKLLKFRLETDEETKTFYVKYRDDLIKVVIVKIFNGPDPWAF